MIRSSESGDRFRAFQAALSARMLFMRATAAAADVLAICEPFPLPSSRKRAEVIQEGGRAWLCCSTCSGEKRIMQMGISVAARARTTL